jgi:hypothetical protein
MALQTVLMVICAVVGLAVVSVVALLFIRWRKQRSAAAVCVAARAADTADVDVNPFMGLVERGGVFHVHDRAGHDGAHTDSVIVDMRSHSTEKKKSGGRVAIRPLPQLPKLDIRVNSVLNDSTASNITINHGVDDNFAPSAYERLEYGIYGLTPASSEATSSPSRYWSPSVHNSALTQMR